MRHFGWLFPYSIEFLIRSLPLDLLLRGGYTLFLLRCPAHIGLVPLSAAVIAGDRSVASILLVLVLLLQRAELHGPGVHTVVYRAVGVLPPRIRVYGALVLLVIAALLVVCLALVRSIGDGVIFLTSTSFLLHTSGILLVVNIDDKFSPFRKLN